MISFLIKWKKWILYTVVACFLGSIAYVGVGAIREEYTPNAAVAKVGKETIKYRDYQRALKNANETFSSQETEEEDNLLRKQVQQIVLQSLIYENTLKQAAISMGFDVSNMEIAYYIQNNPAFNTTGSFNKDTYLWIIRNRLGMNAAEYEKGLKDAKLAQDFKQTISLVAKVSPKEEEFMKTVVYKGEEGSEGKLFNDKINSLLNSFSQDFNRKNLITFTKLAPNYQTED
jgi:hypothetical protein